MIDALVGERHPVADRPDLRPKVLGNDPRVPPDLGDLLSQCLLEAADLLGYVVLELLPQPADMLGHVLP